jgi:hypothetical protein
LKQQQAGVIEAREAVKQATETFKQGRSIMLFTVIAIIFLPLSFCTSLFGMNAAEFNDGHLTIKSELSYMIPISVGTIIISFLLAFSSNSFISALFSLAFATIKYPINVSLTWLFTKTGLYTFSRDMSGKANALAEKDRKATTGMKANALRETMEWKVAKELLRDEIQEIGGKMKIGKRPEDEESGHNRVPSGSKTTRDDELLYYPKTVRSDLS